MKGSGLIQRIKNWWFRKRLRSQLIWVSGSLFLLLFWFSLPSPLFNEPTSFVLEDRNGILLQAVIAADGQWRFPEADSVPKRFEDCITAFEDKRFFYHPGVDPIALGRAIIRDIRSGNAQQGGSTLTMQVMRLAMKNRHRSIWNKLKESIQAVRLECRYSKKKILALYASHAPFGSNVVGLEAAAWRYYGRPASQLSWGEMATLAVLPNAPSLIYPGRNQQALLKKRNQLLTRLSETGKISKEDAALAILEPLPGAPHDLPQNALHLLQRFKTDLAEMHHPATRLKTTLDASLQQRVAFILEQHHQTLKGNGIFNAAALVLDVETGAALAYVGNIRGNQHPELESQVDIIGARRSPGSTLKPFLYGAMLQDGAILPEALIPDIPMQLGDYAPQNFDRGYDGAVPASNALARSLNVPAVKLLQQYKYARFHEALKQVGITTLNHPPDFYGLSLVLGGCEVTMWDLAGAYASMARILNHASRNQGIASSGDIHPPVYGWNGTVLNSPPTVAAYPMDATSIYFTFQAMREVMRPGEEGLWQLFGSAQQVAWKTGTSFGFRDGWAIGVTPKNVVAVWVGNADGEGRPGLIGIQTAAPILFEIIRQLPEQSWFQKPMYRYRFVPVCRKSGFRAGPDCEVADTLYAPEKGMQSPVCPYHRLIHLDASGQFQVTSECESPANMIAQKWFVLTPAMEYYYRQRNAGYVPLPAFKSGCDEPGGNKSMELIYPAPGSRIFVPREITGEKGRTVFRAAHRRAGAKIFWSLDNEYVGTTDQFHQLALDPKPGKHLITLVDEAGYSISRSFEAVTHD